MSRDLCFMGNKCTRTSDIEKNVAFTNLRIVVTRVWLYLLILTASKILNNKMMLPKYICNRASIPQSTTQRTAIILFMVVVVYPTFVIPQGSTCPRKCQCIWRDSKITVDCSDKSLASIPTTVETNTQGKLNNSKYG